MQLIIKIDENNQPVDHPILFDNFLMLYPDADFDNLPEGYVKFIRVEKPLLGPFKIVSNTPTYEWDNGTITDKWEVTELTADEKTQLIEQRTSEIPFPSWKIDLETLQFVPPVPFPPLNGKRYDWNESTQTWVESTP